MTRGYQRFGVAIAAAIVMTLETVSPSPADPQLHLSWNAPFGQPRAARDLAVACADSGARDTLFLTYRTGRSSAFFIGLEGALVIRPLPGDTLGDFWRLDPAAGLGNIAVEFSTDAVPGTVRPFSAGQGFSGVFPARGPAQVQINLVSVLPISRPVAVGDSAHYFLARVVVSRPPGRSACARPLCFEWTTAEFGLDSTVVTRVSRGGRFATWNWPRGTPCGED